MADKVLVTREIPEAGLRPLEGFDLTVLSEAPPERAELLEAVRGATGVLSNVTEKIDAEFMDAAGPDLKVVANMAVGYDNIDVPLRYRRMPAPERRDRIVRNQRSESGHPITASGFAKLNVEAVGHASECPPTPRTVNMNRIGAALLGEVDGPPIRSLYVFAANPVASSPNASRIIEGLRRDDLFTVVHELFLTDTARYADIVLPATTQLEHLDVHTSYGHTYALFNEPAVAPLGQAKPNTQIFRELAAAVDGAPATTATTARASTRRSATISTAAWTASVHSTSTPS